MVCRRRRLLLAPVSLRSVGDAVLAAASLVEAAESEAKEATAERDAREKAELTRALGLESDGKIPPALRAQIRQLEEDQKRRAKRARTDVLDRAMIDLLSFYRDVLTTQMGSDVERVNLDLSYAVDPPARRAPSSPWPASPPSRSAVAACAPTPPPCWPSRLSWCSCDPRPKDGERHAPSGLRWGMRPSS